MSNTTTDHDEIRRWAESHGGVPAAVDRTHEDGGDVGIIRLMFPKNKASEHGALVEISWDEFFEQFDEAELALIYDENSLFNKLIGRDTADKRAHGENDAARHKGRRSSSSASAKAGASSKAKPAASKTPASKARASKADGAAPAPRAKAKSDGAGGTAKRAAARSSTSKAAPSSARLDSTRSKSSSGSDSDLKSREYVGKDGEIHHHTHAYMDKHR